MVDSHYEILWADKYGAYLGHHPIENYAVGLDDAYKQALVAQHCLRSKILGLCIKNYLTTNDKHKLRYFKSAYNFNAQDDGSAMFFAIVKMVGPDTNAGWSDIKSNLENMKMSHFKQEIPKSNL